MVVSAYSSPVDRGKVLEFTDRTRTATSDTLPLPNEDGVVISAGARPSGLEVRQSSATLLERPRGRPNNL